MAPLVTAAQFQSPSVLASVQSGLQTRRLEEQSARLSREEANKQRLQFLAEQQASSQLATRQRALGVPAEAPVDETQQEAEQRALAANPEIMKEILDTVGIRTRQQKEDAAAFADDVLQAQDEESIQFLIDERIRRIQTRNGDATETIRLKDLPPNLRSSALRSLKTSALTTLQREKIAFTREQAEAKERAAAEPGLDPVQSSRILDDGTVQLVRKSGAIEVKSPDDATKELVKQARKFGAELQGLRKGERAAAGAAIKQSIEAFKKLAPIKKNIKNLNEGIRLIDEGAETGVIAKRFPSIRRASVELDNLQGRLGLDVVANVTFGALSEAELIFAKDTALPMGLEGEPLKAWLARKRDAQKGLAESLEEAALFLGEPGNNVPDYIRFKREQQEAQAGQEQEKIAQEQALPLPAGITEADMTETMRVHGMTRKQVLDRLAGR